jgi:hypothetical protein
MEQVQISAYGVPENVAHCVNVEDVGDPDVGEVIFDVLAFPINPVLLSHPTESVCRI